MVARLVARRAQIRAIERELRLIGWIGRRDDRLEGDDGELVDGARLELRVGAHRPAP